jgi:superfamily I DNA/RNA helicase
LAALTEVEHVSIPQELPSFLDSQVKPDGRLPRFGHLIRSIYERFGVLDVEPPNTDDDQILVATLQSAKGLEASVVYLTWMNSTFMPMAGRDEEEQRRLLYVAMTRAKLDVVVTFHERYDPAIRRLLRRELLSPFLEEIAARLNVVRVNAAAIRSNPPRWFQ